jgi:uncharacterized protein YqeY
MEQIRADQLTARKAKDSVRASLLTTLIGEASAVGKAAGNRESTDAEVTAVIQKFIKNIDLTLTHVKDAVALAERAILETYLPKQMSKEQIVAEIEVVKASGVDAKALKGAVMKHFKEKFAGQYDSKAILELI